MHEHAATQAPARRRALGSHPTPEGLARVLVELGLDRLGRVPGLVVDPSCGAGSFLLAAADALVALGVPPREIVTERLAGCDVDPHAVAHCREALRRWAAGHHVTDHVAPQVVEHDPLSSPTPFTARADLVVGNPPFLAQRTIDTARDARRRDALRRRFGELGPYVDDAAAFLLVGTEMLAPGGVAVLIQPQSVLSARDASAVRDHLLQDAVVVALWADAAPPVAAGGEVCAPVRRAGPLGAADGAAAVALRWGGDAVDRGWARAPRDGESWGPLLGAALGVPVVAPPAAAAPSGRDRAARGRAPGTATGPTIGDVATATAGFRDEFYALTAAARAADDPGRDERAPRLVTVGMIDVCRLDTTTPRRLAGRRVVDPRLDVHALIATSPRVAAWVTARRVPKVLVATQTKVPEAVADPTGALVPVTPVLSVEPSDDAGVDVWHLAAALSAPTVAASVARDHAGSGLSLGAVRLSAASIRSLLLPVDAGAWAEGAEITRRLHQVDGSRAELLRQLGAAMLRAHLADPDPGLLEWWWERSGGRRGRLADERA